MSTVLQLAIVLGIMVLVHEFGHFAVAKLCGIRVEVFSIGFGKRIIGFRRGDTEYQIAMIPLGGYVKMAGEMSFETVELDNGDTRDPGDFHAHPRWHRVLVALAGPFANFVLAIALLTFGGMLHNEVQEYIDNPAHTDYIPAKTPAAATGIKSGDTIVHFDTVENPTWEDVFTRAALNLNQTVPFSYTHDGQRVDTKLFVASKGSNPDDFTPEKLGLIAQMQSTPVQIDLLTDDPTTPAAQAGLKAGDRILTIDDLKLHSVPALLAYLQDQAGKPATLTVQRGDTTIPVQITPKLLDGGDGVKLYRLGFAPVQPPVKVQRLPFGKALKSSWTTNLKYGTLIVEVVKRMFTRQVSVRSLSGPIGIATQIHQAAEMQGWMPLIGLMAYISINLGIFNLLPIPILDGGMILFLVIESIMRRDLNQQIKERVYQAAFVCLIAFAAMVIFNDITKLSFFTHLKS
jgi:regulator of sigma E protease